MHTQLFHIYFKAQFRPFTMFAEQTIFFDISQTPETPESWNSIDSVAGNQTN